MRVPGCFADGPSVELPTERGLKGGYRVHASAILQPDARALTRPRSRGTAPRDEEGPASGAELPRYPRNARLARGSGRNSKLTLFKVVSYEL